MNYFALILALCYSLFSTAVSAENIIIPIASQGKDSNIERPQRGLSKEQVESQYGMPSSRNGPEGVPPISRWDYPGFSVYFESNAVIHSVIRHQPTYPANTTGATGSQL